MTCFARHHTDAEPVIEATGKSDFAYVETDLDSLSPQVDKFIPQSQALSRMVSTNLKPSTVLIPAHKIFFIGNLRMHAGLYLIVEDSQFSTDSS